VQLIRQLLRRAGRVVRSQDLAWLALISLLGAFSPSLNNAEIQLLVALGLLQVLEPRIAAFSTSRGQVLAILLKLLLGYLLIGVSGGVTSSYYLILLVPVVSAATTLSAVGAFLVTLLAGLSYLSFLLFVDWGQNVIFPDDFRELSLRVLFLCLISFLTYQLVKANRTQALNFQSVAEQLADANRNLQLAEAAVRRSERLAAMGQLTAGLAHELRNPLGTMRASADVLLKSVAAENDVARELAGFIATEVDRTNSLITRFLDFARPLKLRRSPIDLAELLDRAISQLEKHQPPFEITVHRNYSPDVRPIPLDEELMGGVIYNLLENAAQATPRGGNISVKTRPTSDGAEIAIIDRGSGIAPGDLENIFNPFFTTKATGVGLGLALVSKIVDEHRGKIAVESEPGRGSVFRVVLPAVTQT
jgi:two-component system, NtrC family, sensor histidine kinase HydH